MTGTSFVAGRLGDRLFVPRLVSLNASIRPFVRAQPSRFFSSQRLQEDARDCFCDLFRVVPALVVLHETLAVSRFRRVSFQDFADASRILFLLSVARVFVCQGFLSGFGLGLSMPL